MVRFDPALAWRCPICFKSLYSRNAWRHHLSVKHSKDQRETARSAQERRKLNPPAWMRDLPQEPDMPTEDELRFATDPEYRAWVEEKSKQSADELAKMLKSLQAGDDET